MALFVGFLVGVELFRSRTFVVAYEGDPKRNPEGHEGLPFRVWPVEADIFMLSKESEESGVYLANTAEYSEGNSSRKHGRGAMELDVGMVFKKPLHPSRFAIGNIVQDDVDFLVAGLIEEKLFEKGDEFLTGMAA